MRYKIPGAVAVAATGALLSAWLSPAYAVTIMLQKSAVGANDGTQRIALYVDGNRMAYRGRRGGEMVFDGNRNIAWNYDAKHGIYVEMTLDDARRISGRSDRAASGGRTDAAEDGLLMMGAVRRAAATKAGTREKSPVYRRLGGTARVGRWSCVPVGKMGAAGRIEERMCIASFKELGISARDRKAFVSRSQFEALLNPGHGYTLRAQKQIKIQGLAVRDIGPRTRTTIVSILPGHIHGDMFRRPAGAKKIFISVR